MYLAVHAHIQGGLAVLDPHICLVLCSMAMGDGREGEKGGGEGGRGRVVQRLDVFTFEAPGNISPSSSFASWTFSDTAASPPTGLRVSTRLKWGGRAFLE